MSSQGHRSVWRWHDIDRTKWVARRLSRSMAIAFCVTEWIADRVKHTEFDTIFANGMRLNGRPWFVRVSFLILSLRFWCSFTTCSDFNHGIKCWKMRTPNVNWHLFLLVYTNNCYSLTSLADASCLEIDANNNNDYFIRKSEYKQTWMAIKRSKMQKSERIVVFQCKPHLI